MHLLTAWTLVVFGIAGTAAGRVPTTSGRTVAPLGLPRLLVQSGLGAEVMAFSPDGKKLLSAGWTIDLRDADTGDLRWRLPCSEPTGVAFSADGAEAVVAHSRYDARGTHPVLARIDCAAGRLREVPLAASAGVERVALSGDGSRAAGIVIVPPGSEPTAIRVWNARTGLPVATLPFGGSVYFGRYTTPALSYDGTHIAAVEDAAQEREPNVAPSLVELQTRLCLWNTSTGERCTTQTWPVPPWRVPVLSHDGERVLVQRYGESDIENVVYETRRGKLLWHADLPGRERPAGACFSADGAYAAIAAGKRLRLCDGGTGATVRDFSEKARVTAFALEPHGAALATATSTDQIRLSKSGSGTEVWRVLPQPHPSMLSGAFAFSCDGRQWAFPRGAISLWRPGNAQFRTLPRPPDPGDTVFSPDGRFLAVSSGTKHFQLLDTTTGAEQRFSFPTRSEPNDVGTGLSRLRFLPNGSHLLTVEWQPRRTSGYHSVLRLWNLKTQTQRLLLSGDFTIGDVATTPNGKLLVISTCPGGVGVYTLDGRPLRMLGARLQVGAPLKLDRDGLEPAGQPLLGILYPESVAVVSNGLIATSGRKAGQTRVYLWDATTGRKVGVIDPRMDFISRLQVASDGTLAVCGRASTFSLPRVDLWNPNTGQLLHSSRLPGGTDVLALRPDVRLAALSTWDGTIGLWDVHGDRLAASIGWSDYRAAGRTGSAWIIYTPEGYYMGSPDVDRILRWRENGTLFPASRWAVRFHRPDRVRAALRGIVSGYFRPGWFRKQGHNAGTGNRYSVLESPAGHGRAVGL